MKHKRSRFLYAYDGILLSYHKKQIRRKVKKCFMSDSEFLGIYDLYTNIHNMDDFRFVVKLIETSKTFRHYKTNLLYVRTYYEKGIPLFRAIEILKKNKKILGCDRILLKAIVEWLFSHTIHTNSLNSVTFR